MQMRQVIPVMSLVLVLTADAATAAKKKPTSTPSTPSPPSAPVPAPARVDSTTAPYVLTPVTSVPAPVSRTPGPLLTPGSPIEDRTTIVPFPIPGDTSRAAIAHAKIMNIPREGLTLASPLPAAYDSDPAVSQWSRLVEPRQGGQFYLLTRADTPPYLLAGPAAEYPKAARDAGIQGTVAVVAHVGADGKVGETNVVKSIPALDDAAVQAVKRLMFRPAANRGYAVAVWVGVPVRFTLH
jgi:protein TonB